MNKKLIWRTIQEIIVCVSYCTFLMGILVWIIFEVIK